MPTHQTEVVAIYFPSWHPDEHYSAWYGPGWTEWELVKSTQPLYPGHRQPKQPTWGCFDESDPDWAARQIDLAATHGITAFMFDWYWYSGVRFLYGALDRGFLQAPNRNQLKFFLMWANHTWGPWPGVTGVPGMGSGSPWLPMRHDAADLTRVIDYCVDHYFAQPNYLHVGGRPVLAVYQPTLIADQLADPHAPLARMSERAHERGLPGIHFIGNVGCMEGNVYCWRWDLIPALRDMGYESAFGYNIVRTPAYPHLPNDRPLVDYADVIQSHAHVWHQCTGKGLPFHPVVTVGCDVSPRWHRGVSLPMDFRSWSYEPIIENNTPERFGRLCTMALDHLQQNPREPRMMFINAWNEWTEGMYLLPEVQHGTGTLEALRDALTRAG